MSRGSKMIADNKWFADEDDTCEKDPVDTRRLHSIIDQFRYIRIQPKTIDISTEALLLFPGASC